LVEGLVEKQVMANLYLFDLQASTLKTDLQVGRWVGRKILPKEV
jgi:uncharacterized protein YdeI (BOF family)